MSPADLTRGRDCLFRTMVATNRGKNMHFRRGLREWGHGFTAIAARTYGIERAVGWLLYSLTLLSPTQWLYIGFGREMDRSVNTWIDLYVVVAFVISVLSFLFPSLTTGLLSTYFSGVTLVAVLNIVLLQRVFGAIVSPERSLLLFICNIAQIVLMFATWYFLGGEKAPLLRSVLTFATIGYSETMPRTTIAQIAIDFVLLAVYLSHLVGRVGK
jgi:hypothetical protein